MAAALQPSFTVHNCTFCSHLKAILCALYYSIPLAKDPGVPTPHILDKASE